MTKLREIPVLFDQERHTYTNTETGEYYKGITGTLIHRLFPDKYKDIPEEVLRKAAERGSMVHEEIELAETIGVTPSSQEGKNYLKLKEQNGLVFLESEHTVSDLKHYATNIDVIYDVEEGVVDIADFKTTSKLDTDSVAWQLSICARFLEMNNPGLKVRRLLAIWLRGDIAEVIEVVRRTDEEVDDLIQADLEDRPVDYKPALPDYIMQNETSLYVIGKRIKELQEQYDAMKAEILERMQADGLKSADTGRVLVTYVKATQKDTFDSKKFKEEHGDMYKDYLKKTETKASLKVTLR